LCDFVLKALVEALFQYLLEEKVGFNISDGFTIDLDREKTARGYRIE